MLKVVQGNIFEFVIVLYGIHPSLVNEVIFESEKLGIREIAEQEEDVYRIRISGERTKSFPLGFQPYNITVTLLDNEKLTVKRSKVEVLKKVGEVASG